MFVRDDGEGEDDSGDKGISGLTLDEITDQSLKMSVKFKDTEAISSDITEPDILEFRLLQPGLFIDEETLEPIDISSSMIEVALKPQLSQAEYEEISDMAETAVAVGLVSTIVELSICFVLGKALEAMWTMVYAMQFLVFIGMWQIGYTNRLRFFFEELKRIALGEFLDYLGLEERFFGFISFDNWIEEDGPEEKIGYARFG